MFKQHFLLLLAGTLAITTTFAQTPGLKGDGKVFYSETFGWENPADPKGWTAPAGFYMLDPKDIGYNWHWWPNDSLITRGTKEPPMRSTTGGNGSICLFLDRYNEDVVPKVVLDNSVVFPTVNCSSHGTVIVRYETCFMCYNSNNTWQMLMEVTVDNWLHSAQYDVSFGVGHKGRPNNTTPGKPAIYEANISDVAAGQPNVQIRFTWRNTSLYFWQIDDFQLSEAFDNDLQMRFAQMEWNDGNDATIMTPVFMMPKTQLGNGSYINFKSAVLNFGEYDQEDTFLDLDISKNNQSIFHQQSPKKDLYTLVIDTTLIEEEFKPTEFGHYKVAFAYKQKETESKPADNDKEFYFNITDSVYSHADNSAEEDFIWGMEAYGPDGSPNLGHLVGTKYHIFADCEVSSISAFIAGGKCDGLLDYRFVLYYVPLGTEDETPIELLLSESVVLTPDMIQTWVSMPLSKDGESEFLKAGDLVYACIEYNNQNTDLTSKRFENLRVGADYSFRILDPVSVAKADGDWSTGGYVAERNLMIRLNLNNHENIIDGNGVIPLQAFLAQNYPNPFRGSTRINFELTTTTDVAFVVTDISGRKVMELTKGVMPAGKHAIELETGNLEAGIYFYTMRAGNFVKTRQLVVTK